MKRTERIYGRYEFKVGDRVRVIPDNKTGTIIRTPVEGEKWAECKQLYIVGLDDKNYGWEATKERHLVDNESAWYTVNTDMVLLKDEPKKTLKPNKWYDAETFTEKELKELLPVGTKVVVTEEHDNERIPYLHREKLISTCVKNIGERLKEETRIGVTGCCFWRRYFKIVEE